jgi:hypothetical protein
VDIIYHLQVEPLHDFISFCNGYRKFKTFIATFLTFKGIVFKDIAPLLASAAKRCHLEATIRTIYESASRLCCWNGGSGFFIWNFSGWWVLDL